MYIYISSISFFKIQFSGYVDCIGSTDTRYLVMKRGFDGEDKEI